MAGRRLSSNDVSVVIALAIVVLVLLLIYVAERGEGRAEQTPPADGADARGAAGNGVVRAMAQAPELDALRAAGADDCGIETATPGQSESEADAVVDRQRDEALQVILPALEARSEPRARAAGLYFRATRSLVDTLRTDACKEAPETCPATEQRRLDDSESAEALARLAVHSSDPQVYAWAYRSCARVSRQVAGSCQLVNALQWSRLDPENAVPWLAVAQEAKGRKDASGLDDAMFHVAAATIHDFGWGRAPAYIIEAAPADQKAVGTWLAASSAITYEAIDLPSLSEVSPYCDASALANANRRATCDRIASLLVDRSTTSVARIIGIGIAKRLDWPAARLASAELERDAANALVAREAPQFGEPTACANVRSDLARLEGVGRLGEVESVKRQIVATGESIETLAAEYRRAFRFSPEPEAARAAASAASAASGG